MIDLLKIKEELKFFNNIKFNAENHTYSLNGTVFKESVTQWVKNFKEKFDKDFWSKYKAKERGISQEEVLSEWDYISKESTDEIGTPFHNYIQNLLEKNISVINYDIINPELIKLIILAQDFNEKIKGKYIHIASEVIVGDIDMDVAGSFDQLFYNVLNDTIELWDWKTSKVIELLSYKDKRMFYPFDNCLDCNFYHYSLQLNLYKYIIEKFTNIKIDVCRIANFNYINNEYKIYKCVDLQEQIKTLFIR